MVTSEEILYFDTVQGLKVSNGRCPEHSVFC